MTAERKICVGVFVGAHGVRGLVKLRSMTEDPHGIFSYKPLTDESGAPASAIKLKNVAGDCFVVSVEGIDNREAAQALRGVKLFALRSALPKTKKGEYYQADLIGLAARDAQGRDYGKVMAVHDYGAGVFFEIGRSRKDSFMLPFNDACVPDVDLKTGTVLIAPPEGWVDEKVCDPE